MGGRLRVGAGGARAAAIAAVRGQGLHPVEIVEQAKGKAAAPTGCLRQPGGAGDAEACGGVYAGAGEPAGGRGAAGAGAASFAARDEGAGAAAVVNRISRMWWRDAAGGGVGAAIEDFFIGVRGDGAGRRGGRVFGCGAGTDRGVPHARAGSEGGR